LTFFYVELGLPNYRILILDDTNNNTEEESMMVDDFICMGVWQPWNLRPSPLGEP